MGKGGALRGLHWPELLHVKVEGLVLCGACVCETLWAVACRLEEVVWSSPPHTHTHTSCVCLCLDLPQEAVGG